jgi:hypothetical protein
LLQHSSQASLAPAERVESLVALVGDLNERHRETLMLSVTLAQKCQG